MVFGGLFILVVTTFFCLLVGGFITDLPYVSMTIIALHRYPVQLLLKESFCHYTFLVKLTLTQSHYRKNDAVGSVTVFHIITKLPR